MRIALRGGHNFKATGASGLIDEVTENRKVYKIIKSHLEQLGHTVIDVTPTDMPKESDLPFGVNKANNAGVDLFCSIHFNNAYKTYDGAIGCETLVHSVKTKESESVVNNLGVLGFKNRGVKVRPELYELRNTKMNALIVEVCFVEATKDVELYRALGVDVIGKAIAYGLIGKDFKLNEQDAESTSTSVKKINIELNGKIKNVEAINIDGINFVKLRDLADDKIEVSYDGVKNVPVVKVLKV